jgi:hypothetical protein
MCRKKRKEIRSGRAGSRGEPVKAVIRIFALPALFLSLASACRSDVSSVTVRVSHLLYPDYRQILTVKMFDKFQLGDTDLSAAVVEFVPDFAIDTVSHKIVSGSRELRNPAFKIVVTRGGEKKEEHWAFFKAAVPHFTRQSGLVFEILAFKVKGKTYQREGAK